MNGAAVTEDEPCTMPASPDAVNVASSAVLVKLPWPRPLFHAEPAQRLSKVSVGNSSEFVLTPAPSTIGDLFRMTVSTDGSVSATIVGRSLAPSIVTVTV